MKSYTLTPKSLQSFENIVNKASQDSAKSLSQLLGRKTKIRTHSVRIIPPEKMHEQEVFPDKDIIAAVFSISGIESTMITFIPEESMEEITQTITKQDYSGEITKEHILTFSEIGNILTGAFLHRLSLFLNQTLIQSVPHHAQGMYKALFDEIAADFAVDSAQVLLFNVSYELSFEKKKTQLTNTLLRLEESVSSFYLHMNFIVTAQHGSEMLRILSEEND